MEERVQGDTGSVLVNTQYKLCWPVDLLGRRAEELQKRRAAFFASSPPPPFLTFTPFSYGFTSPPVSSKGKLEVGSARSSSLPSVAGSREATGGIFSHFSHPAFIILQFSGSVRISRSRYQFATFDTCVKSRCLMWGYMSIVTFDTCVKSSAKL